jgi:predicted nucleic acid-binding protein
VSIVFDTNVLARAHQLAHGPARRGLLFVATGSDVLILSQYLLQELRRILTYPRLVRNSGLTPLDISGFLRRRRERAKQLHIRQDLNASRAMAGN